MVSLLVWCPAHSMAQTKSLKDDCVIHLNRLPHPHVLASSADASGHSPQMACALLEKITPYKYIFIRKQKEDHKVQLF